AGRFRHGRGAHFYFGRYYLLGYPPSPMPLEPLSSAGFAKQVRQNLEPKGFRYQNLDRKRFTGFPMPFAPTASASTMMTGLREEGKVGCHNVRCGFPDSVRAKRRHPNDV